MITEIRIKNFKSIHKLRFELGRVNVLIGANGSGKSNILEAIVMGAAAQNKRLDKEFLASRGIRVTIKPEWMRSAFEKEETKIPIKFKAVDNDGTEAEYNIQNTNQSIYSKWNAEQQLVDDVEQARSTLASAGISRVSAMGIIGPFDDYIMTLNDFMIFSPEESMLRQFDTVEQSVTLGKNGSGLFQYLRYLSQLSEDKWDELKSLMKLLDWYDDMDIPDNLLSGERTLKIRDRYVDPALNYFDQKSANEGFLFLLFYFALMIGDETPKFFAIDNIDASLNPRLCKRLMRLLVELAKKHDKQIILTTHNPIVLDGLYLDDPDQRLFAVSRNVFGHTNIHRFHRRKPLNGTKPIKLSEAFVRGYLGGLPKNF